MFTTEFLGDSKSPNPQRLREIIHDDIGSLILDQPLDLAIQHLQTLLKRSSRAENSKKLRLHHRYSYGFYNSKKIYLEGERLETIAEVDARLEEQRSYVRDRLERKQDGIRKLETRLEVLRKEAEQEEQKLKGISC